MTAWGPDRIVNLAHHRLVGDADEDRRERLGDLLAEATAAWEPYLHPEGTDERPIGAPAWWRGDDEAAHVTQAGVSTLQRRAGTGG